MEKRLFVPKAAVAWLKCRPEGDTLKVFPPGGGAAVVLSFPRQRIREKLCIPDFFAPQGDVLGCFAVTVGNPVASGPVRYCKDAFDSLTVFREWKETGQVAPSPPPAGK